MAESVPEPRAFRQPPVGAPRAPGPGARGRPTRDARPPAAAAAPRATYRLQLHAGFGFDDASDVAPYLAALGVSHLYCSPFLQAAPGSMHGYDVVDPARVNDELGGEDGFRRFARTCAALGLRLVLDVVPNHMAVWPGNAWWWDVLENGEASRYAGHFDVDWDPPESRLRHRVLVPVLGDHYGRVLEAGALHVERRGGTFAVRYREHAFPVAPHTLPPILARALARRPSDELAFLADAFAALPAPTATDRASVERRHRDKEVLRGHLERLCARDPGVGAAIDATLATLDADALDALLDRQSYRLAFWRTARRELDYRRFFDVHHLVGLQSDRPDVFAATHVRIVAWVREGVADGLRIDHIDGLADPQGYLDRVRRTCPGAWLVVEKILAHDERLPARWPVDGTTGYDFLVLAGGLFVDPAGEEGLSRLYDEIAGASHEWPALVRAAKEAVLRDGLASELTRLTALFLDVCEGRRRQRDYTRHELHEALCEAIVAFPVYRTYVRPAAAQVSEDDARHVTTAVRAAATARPDLDGELFALLADVLLLRLRGAREDELVTRFQQLTGPAMAKGVEDTALYRFNRLVGLNEVGGDPARFGTGVEEFHAACLERQARLPRGMLATSTHDTKRSEDVRARLALLSEMPERWAQAVRRWTRANERHRTDGAPDRNAEYLFYQTLVGAWPLDRERALAYAIKAAREARAHTSWTDPCPGHEAALRRFVEGTLGDPAFTADLAEFLAPMIEPGHVNALAQTLLKLTAPGVPDLYQGTELWDASLVDPDNRRPVDYAVRRALLDALDDATPEAVLARRDEGLPKLWVVERALALRRRHPDAFGARGGYRPLRAEGTRAAHVVAFARGDAVITVVPRLVWRLGGRWDDTTLELPPGRWTNVLGDDTHGWGATRLADLLRRFPAALLARDAR
jgi:(1->4)-alpha-D-glucan 1-alpha-D-glucosylmutase